MKIKNTDGTYCKIKDIKVSGLKAYVTLVIYSSVPQTSADSLGNTHRVFSFYLRDRGSTKLYSLSKNNYWIDRNHNYSMDSSNIDINMYKEVILEIDISNYGQGEMLGTKWVRYCNIVIINSLDYTEELWNSEDLNLISKEVILPDITNIDIKNNKGLITTSFTCSYKTQEDFNYSNTNIKYKVKILEPNTNFLLEEQDLILTQKDFLTLYPIITSTFEGYYLSPIIVCIELLNTKNEILKQFKTFINPTITQPKVSIITNSKLQAKKAYILTPTISSIVKINII